eukprot:7530079-Ditylum_brightwellii.AAC.1
MASTNVANAGFITFRKLKSLIQRSPVNTAKKLNHSSEYIPNWLLPLVGDISNPKQMTDIIMDATSTIVHG